MAASACPSQCAALCHLLFYYYYYYYHYYYDYHFFWRAPHSIRVHTGGESPSTFFLGPRPLIRSFIHSFLHSFIHSFINEDSACLGPFFYFLFSVFFSSSSRDSRQSHHVLLPLAVLNNNNNNKKNNNNNHHHNQVPPSPFFVSSKQQINKAANVSLAVFFLPSPFFSSCNSTTFSSLRMGGSINRRKATTAVSPSRSFSVDVLRREQKN